MNDLPTPRDVIPTDEQSQWEAASFQWMKRSHEALDRVNKMKAALEEIREKVALHTKVDLHHILAEIDSIAYCALEASDD